MNAGAIDGRLLLYFLAVAEELHFTRAAQRLYVSQPALSNQIKRLEEHLGTAMFTRSAQGVHLTPAGAAFLPYARQALAALQAGAASVAGTPSVLRVDVIDAALATPRLILRRLRAAASDLPLRITTLGTAHQRQRILAGELDVGFCGQDAATDPHLAHDIVRHEPIDVVLPVDHRLAGSEHVSLQELADEVFYLPHDTVAPEWNAFIGQACEQAGFTPRRHATATDGAEFGLDLVRDGECVTLGLRSTPHPPGTVALPLNGPLRYPWAMMWRRDDPAKAITQIRQAARDVAAAHRWVR